MEEKSGEREFLSDFVFDEFGFCRVFIYSECRNCEFVDILVLLICFISFPVIGSFLCIGVVSLRVPLRAFSTRDCTGPGDGCSVGLIFLLTDGSSAKAFMLG